MLSTDTLMELVLGSDLFILAGVLTLIIRSLRGGRGKQLEAVLEAGDERITTAAQVAENLYAQAKIKYEAFKAKVQEYRDGAADGISLEDAEVVSSDLKSLMESIESLVPGKVKL